VLTRIQDMRRTHNGNPKPALVASLAVVYRGITQSPTDESTHSLVQDRQPSRGFPASIIADGRFLSLQRSKDLRLVRRLRVHTAFKNPMNITGLHHVTAIASGPQRNIDFYVEVLGLRLVKRTVNFDDPGTYHFYFGDAVGTPGTILTFFPWPSARRGTHGSGEVSATAFAIPPKSTGYWLDRLKEYHISAERAPKRFNEEVVRFADPDRMLIELIESTGDNEVIPWNDGLVPAEHVIRGFHSVSVMLQSSTETAKLLTETLGYHRLQETGNRIRFVAGADGGIGRIIDLISAPGVHPGRPAAGSVHHIAFRVPNDEEQVAWREKLIELGYQVSPVMDRTYFHSIYFREPGGVLFELATDPPGFTQDEAVDGLGADLRLPPWMERARPEIEKLLPKIAVPTKATR
jgi:glyoxalase family protein